MLRVTLNGMTARASIMRNVIGYVRDVVEGLLRLANGGLLRSFVEWVAQNSLIERTVHAAASRRSLC